MSIIKSHLFLCAALKGRRIMRRFLPANTTEKHLRNLFLGRAPAKRHPLNFFWTTNTQYLNSWILHGESILYIWKILNKIQPSSILELGSGWSSIMFATYARQVKNSSGKSVSIISIEHDNVWADHTKKLLDDQALGTYVTILVCPMQKIEINGISGQIYKLESLKSRTFEFGLIDGPTTQIGRQLTLPSIIPFMRTGSIIFLDDAQRTTEFNLINLWQKNFSNSLRFKGYSVVGNGLARFEML